MLTLEEDRLLERVLEPGIHLHAPDCQAVRAIIRRLMDRLELAEHACGEVIEDGFHDGEGADGACRAIAAWKRVAR